MRMTIAHTDAATDRVMSNHLACSLAKRTNKNHDIHTVKRLSNLLTKFRSSLAERSNGITITLRIFHQHCSTFSASECSKKCCTSLELCPLDSKLYISF